MEVKSRIFRECSIENLDLMYIRVMRVLCDATCGMGLKARREKQREFDLDRWFSERLVYCIGNRFLSEEDSTHHADMQD